MLMASPYPKGWVRKGASQTAIIVIRACLHTLISLLLVLSGTAYHILMTLIPSTASHHLVETYVV